MKATKKALLSSVLALFMCFTMLVGTTYAWFTDSVTSAGNIIKAGTLDVTMEWAEGNLKPENATWTDASKGAMFDNDLWEPGYVEAKHIKITNVGSLALNYKLRIVANGIVSKLANVIDVYYFSPAEQLTRDTATTGRRLGTLAQVLGSGEESANALYRTVNGALEAGKNTTLTLALKMQESAGNEYQGLAIGTDFSVELIATQRSFENDSFGPEYDIKVPDEEIPYAFVTPLEKDQLSVNATINEFGSGKTASPIIMDAAYQFEPTIFNENPDGNSVADDVDSSKYKQYHADFYVSADKDIAGGTIGLVGYYGAFCTDFNDENWVSLEYDGETIPAGTGVRLLNDGMGYTCITYKNICQWGNDGIGFRCGLYDINDVLAGTTITVELRLYETTVDWTNGSHECAGYSDETGKYVTVGTFTYTFAKEVKTADEFKDAIANGVETIRLENDVVLDSKVTIAKDKALTLDLNGKTLAAAFDNKGGSALLDNSGSLTIMNGTVVSLAAFPDTDWGTEGFPTYATNTISNKGNLVIGAGAVIENQTNVGGASYAIDNYAGATVTIEEGAVIKAKDVAIRMFANSATAEDKVVINGGTITGKRAVWVQLPSSNSAVAPLATLEINGGELNATSGLVIYSYSYGNSFAKTNITINGGTFNGDINFGGGYKGDVENVTINGGTFNGEVGRWVTDDDFELIVR